MAETVNENIDEIYAQNIFILEKELGGSSATNEDSLLLKFYNQIEFLNKINEEEKKQYDKMNSKGRGTIG